MYQIVLLLSLSVAATNVSDINDKHAIYDKTTQLTQFLMGLGDQYTAIRGQILLISSLPNLSQCYSILLQEENQREVQSIPSMNSGNIAMSVKTNGTRRNFSPDNSRVNSQNYSGHNTKRTNQDSYITCEYCHLTRNSKEKCFCLVGYPPWHKLYGKPKPKPRFANT